MKNYGWHFVGDTLRDGRPVPADGVKLIHEGPVVPCESGLHLSRDPFDALQYAPGATLCLVEYGGTVVSHGDPENKIACSERTILARMDFTEPLLYFARMQALSVVHLWDAPQEIIDYLMIGEEPPRTATWNVCSPARKAVLRAAWNPDWDAVKNYAWHATWSIANNDAWNAAGNAAWVTFQVIGDITRSIARRDFNALVEECFEGPLNFTADRR